MSEASREHHKTLMKELTKGYVDLGLCPRCAGRNPSLPGIQLCAECREEKRKYNKRIAKRSKRWHSKRYKELKALGICGQCGREPTLHGKAACETCLAKRRQKYKERRYAEIACQL